MQTDLIKYLFINNKEVAELKIKGKIAFQRLNYILGQWRLGELPFKGSKHQDT